MRGMNDGPDEPVGDVALLRRMQADAAAPDGLRLLVQRLARALDGEAGLVDPRGNPVPGAPLPPAEVLEPVRGQLDRLRTGRARSVSVHRDGRTVSAQVLEAAPEVPILVISATEQVLGGASALVADAVRLLHLRWRTDEASCALQRVGDSVAAVREVVLRLLMLGRPEDAHRVADVLGPRLPDVVSVCVVESAGTPREEVVEQLIAVAGARSWVVPCPVYSQHVIILAPSGEAEQDADEPVGQVRRLVEDSPALVAGVSRPVALRDSPVGYAEAFHALAVARNSATAVEEFSPHQDLVTVLGRRGRAWAERALAGLLDFEPARPQDPDAVELLHTLRSWLNFGTGATRELTVHRNTLAARLRSIEGLLECDLREIGAQSRLHLALALLGPPTRSRSADDGPDLEELLAGEDVREWARRQLEPLLSGEAHLMPTLRAWLCGNVRLEAAARELGLSVPAARKRLLRIEQRLERSLLHGPSMRYELYFALRVHDAGHPVSAAG